MLIFIIDHLFHLRCFISKWSYIKFSRKKKFISILANSKIYIFQFFKWTNIYIIQIPWSVMSLPVQELVIN